MSLRRVTTIRRTGMAPARGLGGFDAFAHDNPLMWLSASSITGPYQVPTTGTAVSSWYDSSGNARPMLANTGTVTYDAAGFLAFTAARMSGTAFTKSNEYTVYMLGKKTVSTAVGWVSADGPSPRWWQHHSDASGAVIVECFTGTSTYSGQLKSANGVNLANVWYVMTLMRTNTATGTVARQNGVQTVSSGAYVPGTSATSRPIVVGGTGDGTGVFTGSVCQVVMYPTGHDATLMTAVETALLATVPA